MSEYRQFLRPETLIEIERIRREGTDPTYCHSCGSPGKIIGRVKDGLNCCVQCLENPDHRHKSDWRTRKL